MSNGLNTGNSTQRKPLIITVIVGLIILIAWLSVKLVSIAPNAFSSLASLAEGIRQYPTEAMDEESNGPTLSATTDKTIINSNEAITVSWNTAVHSGSYVFSYACTEGVAIDLLDTTDGLRAISCDTNYNIGDVDSVLLSVASEKERFETVSYTVEFLAKNDTRPRAESTASFTVVNNNIPEAPITDEPTVTEPDESPTDPSGDTDTATETPEQPTYEQEFTYEIPVSDPNGRTDLSVRFLNVGTIIGNTFFASTISRHDEGAIQFEVKNYGTKTSGEWSYSVTLPTGMTYSATEQAPLKPNERAVITIGFPTTDARTHTFVTRIDEQTDRNTLNDSFSQTVMFSN